MKWAVRGKATCRMHGGASGGPKTKEGRENSRLAALRHGKYTQKTRALHREAMALIRLSKELIANFKD
jgi:hypothetical protein